MDEDEVGRASLRDDSGACLSEQLAASPGGSTERLPRLQAGLHERLDLPGDLIRPGRTATEVRAGRDRDARRVGETDALLRPLDPGGQLLAAVRRGEPLDRRRRAERLP